MNNQIQYRKPAGLSAQGIRILGLLLLLIGAIGTGIVQGKLMAADDSLKIISIALVIEIVQCCAMPLFVFLLVEGVQKTQSMRFYFLRVLIAAVLTEIPFDSDRKLMSTVLQEKITAMSKSINEVHSLDASSRALTDSIFIIGIFISLKGNKNRG